MFFVYFWFNIVVICSAGVLQEICAQNLALSGEKSVLWALYPTCQVLVPQVPRQPNSAPCHADPGPNDIYMHCMHAWTLTRTPT